METKNFTVEKLFVSVHSDRPSMGQAAAKAAAERINAVIAEKGEANVVFAAAPSQNETLEYLLKENIDWTKVRGFHQDEYIGLDPNHSAGFGNFMRRTIFDLVPFKELHYLLCKPEDAEEKCASYSELLKKYPADLIFLGFGENGHMAFNDPAVADFNDPKMVKIVDLDDICRQQQVNDGCFNHIDEVPKQAMTLTMSLIMNIPHAIATVPTVRKADAVYGALCGEVTTACPASILRFHNDAALFVDEAAASKLPDNI